MVPTGAVGTGELAGVVVSGTKGLRAEIRLTESPGCSQVTRTHDGIATEEFVRHALTGTEAALLVRELEILEHDEPYESAMRWLGELLESLGP